jgi:hypothetical protein
VARDLPAPPRRFYPLGPVPPQSADMPYGGEPRSWAQIEELVERGDPARARGRFDLAWLPYPRERIFSMESRRSSKEAIVTMRLWRRVSSVNTRLSALGRVSSATMSASKF